MITVVMPTISGREESCEKMKRLYLERSDGFLLQILTPFGLPNWPTAINSAAASVTGDYVAYVADDLEPLPGWAAPMVACLDRNEVPAPQLWNYVKEGAPVNVADGAPGDVTAFSRVPALTRLMAEQVGKWPEIDYYADNWVSDKCRAIGYQTRVTAGYEFVHHWHQVGRLDGGDWVGRNEPLYRKAKDRI